MILLIIILLITVVVTAVILRGKERYAVMMSDAVMSDLRFREFADGTTENPPYRSLLGGFGTPVPSFDSVPQLELVDKLNALGIYNPSTPGAIYLQTANRSRINNITT
jgi:hypothetical protein